MDWTHDTVFPFAAPLTTGIETTHDVYVGGEGPPILILQELPGIGPETLELAAKLNASGFRVYLPHMFGAYGKKQTLRNLARLFCVRREFNMFAKGRQSPIAGWLRALTSEISTREDGQGVGVIGMCLTGSFALTLMAEDAVVGGVASQPALPLLAGDKLHMSKHDIGAASSGMAAKGPALAMRFAEDRMSPERLMQALEKAFGGLLETIEFPGDEHSLLTLHFRHPAYQKIDAYFKARFGMT